MKKIIILLLSILFLVSCNNKQDNLQYENTPAFTISNYNPVSIVDFSSADEGQLIRFYFQVQDERGQRIAANGQVHIKIFDNANNIVYEKIFPVSSSEYQDYQIVLTGQEIGKAYEWKISKDEIKKGVSNFGKATLEFNTQGKTLTSINDYVEIPTLTKEEMEALNEGQYEKNAIIVNKKVSKGDWEVTVTKAGYYNPLEEYGEQKEYFRVDMVVKSIAHERKYFSPSGMALLDSGKQYEQEYGGTLDTFAELYPNIIKEGYVLFKPLPKTTKSVKLVFTAGYDEDYKDIQYEYLINLK